MKKVFSTLLAASLLLVGTQAFAQLSFNAGYLNSSEATKGKSQTVNSNGAFVGASFNLPLTGGLSVAPGLYYSLITNKDTATGSLFGVTLSGASTFTEHAFNLPVYLNYGFDVARDMRFFIYGGPTAQYGIVSAINSEAAIYSPVGALSDKNRFDNYQDGDYSRFNVYLGGGIGFTAAHIQITVGYDYGMLDQYRSENVEAHRSNLKIGLGYAF